ncbi:MAG: arylesterase [Proteobacteria bacterium]|nr:arylesterase [Pseudomonadota bacterium]
MKTPGYWLFLVVLALLAAPYSGAAADKGVRIAVLGDSLAAGYNLPLEKGFTAQLQKALRQAGYDVTVLNASVSGDTTAGGVARLAWTLADRPQLVMVELGGNDALRGIDPRQTRENIDLILTRLKEAGVEVLLAGMRAPRNLGRDYYTRFDRIYPELAAKHEVPLFPFFLEGVAGKPELNQNDGIHPNAAGIQVIVRSILPTVIEALQPIVRPPPK